MKAVAQLGLLAVAFWLVKRMFDPDEKTPTAPGRIPSNVSPVERATVINAIAARGWPPPEVDGVIHIESGWRTTARNPVSNASGLIQLMPVWFGQHGFRSDLATNNERAAAFRELNALEQLPYILDYFHEVGRDWRVPGDTYLALAAPAYVGEPDERVIYAIGGKAWQQNPAWRESAQGPITAGSIRRVLLRRLGGRNA